MKLTNLPLAIVSSCALVIALTQPARAALVEVPFEVTQPVVGVQTFSFEFSPAEASMIDITISDIGHPAPFAFLDVVITQGSHFLTELKPAPSASDSYSFTATAGAHYAASVFAAAGTVPPGFAFSLFNLTIDQTEITPVPEPGVWLLMLGGIGLVGWMRLRKSESLLR